MSTEEELSSGSSTITTIEAQPSASSLFSDQTNSEENAGNTKKKKSDIEKGLVEKVATRTIKIDSLVQKLDLLRRLNARDKNKIQKWRRMEFEMILSKIKTKRNEDKQKLLREKEERRKNGQLIVSDSDDSDNEEEERKAIKEDAERQDELLRLFYSNIHRPKARKKVEEHTREIYTGRRVTYEKAGFRRLLVNSFYEPMPSSIFNPRVLFVGDCVTNISIETEPWVYLYSPNEKIQLPVLTPEDAQEVKKFLDSSRIGGVPINEARQSLEEFYIYLKNKKRGESKLHLQKLGLLMNLSTHRMP